MESLTVPQDTGRSLVIVSLCHLYEFITHGDKHHSDILVLKPFYRLNASFSLKSSTIGDKGIFQNCEVDS